MACAARLGQTQSAPRAVAIVALLAAVPLGAGADGLVVSALLTALLVGAAWSPSRCAAGLDPGHDLLESQGERHARRRRRNRGGSGGAAPDRVLWSHVPLGGLLRQSDPPRGAALRHAALARRAEPPRPAGRRAAERRRLRPRLVRRAGTTPGLYRSVAPAWGDATCATLAAQIRSPLFLAHIRAATGHAGRADQLPPVPPRPLAVRAQRLHRRLPRAAPRAAARRRPVAVPGDRGDDRLRADVPPRAHLRAGRRIRSAALERMAGFVEATGRRHGIDRAAADDGRRQRRRAALRGPLRQRAGGQLAVRQRGRERRARALPRRRAVRGSSPTRPARSSPSRSATCPASGTRSRRARRWSSSPATTIELPFTPRAPA